MNQEPKVPAEESSPAAKQMSAPTPAPAPNPDANPAATRAPDAHQSKLSNTAFLLIIAAVAVVIAAGLALFAASTPDGLEWSAAELGFIDNADDSAVAGSPLADYSVAGSESVGARMMAGVVGVAITAAVAFGVFHWFRGKSDRRGNAQ